MSTISVSTAAQKTSLVLPILVGGAVAGLLDMTSAYITFGRYMPWELPAVCSVRPRGT
jgi:hypothetical protein